jgi:hypothetical protein
MTTKQSYLFLQITGFPFKKIVSSYGDIITIIKILSKRKSNLPINKFNELVKIIDEY